MIDQLVKTWLGQSTGQCRLMDAFCLKKIFFFIPCSPYDGKWSKTMVGYGDEDNHFVMELTYNYGIKNYKKGNDFRVSDYDLPSLNV